MNVRKNGQRQSEITVLSCNVVPTYVNQTSSDGMVTQLLTLNMNHYFMSVDKVQSFFFFYVYPTGTCPAVRLITS